MRNHSERVYRLKEDPDYTQARQRKEEISVRLRRWHSITLAVISLFLLIIYVYIGSAFPSFYYYVESHPWAQFTLTIIPIVIFGLWRLREMLTK